MDFAGCYVDCLWIKLWKLCITVCIIPAYPPPERRILVDKGKPACYDMLTIMRKEEVNMLKNGWNVYGRRLAPGVTVR